MSRQVTVKQIIKALTAKGWLLDRHANGSAYLSAPVTNQQIRISDHRLGCRADGTVQGGRWAVDITVDRELSLADHLTAIEDDDFRNGGFAFGYSLAEWVAGAGVH